MLGSESETESVEDEGSDYDDFGSATEDSEKDEDSLGDFIEEDKEETEEMYYLLFFLSSHLQLLFSDP